MVMAILTAEPPDAPSIKRIGHSIIGAFPLPVLVTSVRDTTKGAPWEATCASSDFRTLRLSEIKERQPVVMLFLESKGTNGMEFEANVGDAEPPSQSVAESEGGHGSVYLAGVVRGVVTDASGSWVVRWTQ